MSLHKAVWLSRKPEVVFYNVQKMGDCPMRQQEPRPCFYTTVYDPLAICTWQTMAAGGPVAPSPVLGLLTDHCRSSMALTKPAPPCAHLPHFLPLTLWAHHCSRVLQCAEHKITQQIHVTELVFLRDLFFFFCVISVTWLKVQLHIHMPVHNGGGSSNSWLEAAISL